MVTEITKWGYREPTPFVPPLHMVERGTGGEDRPPSPHGGDGGQGVRTTVRTTRKGARGSRRCHQGSRLKRQRVRQFTDTCRVALKDSLTVAGSPAGIPGPTFLVPLSTLLERGTGGEDQRGAGDPKG